LPGWVCPHCRCRRVAPRVGKVSGCGRTGPPLGGDYVAMTLCDDFRDLHAEGTFILPNPWDRGSALALENMGFRALATTSAGLGRSIGKDDQQVTRDELVEHVTRLVSVLHVPLSVDSERLHPDDAGGIAETVRMLARAGASGCSIEDYDPDSGSIVPVQEATEAVETAAAACAEHGLVLTARAENHLYGAGDLDDTVERLVRYAEAGAEVVYAPGLWARSDIGRVVAETGRPVNVLAMPEGPAVPELAALGVRRVSTGARLHGAAHRCLLEGARELLDTGTSEYGR